LPCTPRTDRGTDIHTAVGSEATKEKLDEAISAMSDAIDSLNDIQSNLVEIDLPQGFGRDG
jgi:hypothetical protein